MMHTAAGVVISVVALVHLYFLVLEMFLWTRPFGLKVLRNTAEKARETAALAANQGLYNGFLSAGLIWSLFYPEPGVAIHIAYFFLCCVIVAGIYGGATVSIRIFFVQSVPALAAGILLLVRG
jgi:putative membrane protein